MTKWGPRGTECVQDNLRNSRVLKKLNDFHDWFPIKLWRLISYRFYLRDVLSLSGWWCREAHSFGCRPSVAESWLQNTITGTVAGNVIGFGLYLHIHLLFWSYSIWEGTWLIVIICTCVCCVVLTCIVINRANGPCKGHIKPSSTYVYGNCPSKFEKPSGHCCLRRVFGRNEDCQRMRAVEPGRIFLLCLIGWTFALLSSTPILPGRMRTVRTVRTVRCGASSTIF